MIETIKMLLGMRTCLVKPDRATDGNASFFDLSATTIQGEKFHFSQLKGKKTLIINTASRCGFTDQYSLIESFHRLYNSGVVILGFPSNDFKSQEPESESSILEFCTRNYGVTFQLFEKTNVKDPKKSMVYDWLTDSSKNGWNTKQPTWNFCKYLVDEKGRLLLYAGPRILPTHPEILGRIDT